MKNGDIKFPKTIWFMWYQGYEDAPWLVKRCYQSWKRNNPNWRIIFLDEKNLDQYTNLATLFGEQYRNIRIQALSDITRINLLRDYGGVWVDATCFCCIPLDSWIHPYIKSGFFAFSHPKRDRMISSWFLAGLYDNYLIQKYCEEVNLYWIRHSSLGLSKNRLLKKALALSPSLWFSPLFTKTLKIYPYFWFHYLFESIYKNDSEFKRIWDQTPELSANIPHKILLSGMSKALPSNIKSDIDEKKDPLYKLTLKYKAKHFEEGCTLHYLLSSRP